MADERGKAVLVDATPPHVVDFLVLERVGGSYQQTPLQTGFKVTGSGFEKGRPIVGSLSIILLVS